jgi:citrate lyase beta subunit
VTRYLRLGASLYVPATRDGLPAIGNGHKYPFLRSVIFCTEDAVHERDVPLALDNLAAALRRFEPADVLRFVRVRNPGVLKSVLSMEGAGRLAGFVLPKVTIANLDDYFGLIPGDSHFAVMPTLETVEAFDPSALRKLRTRLAMDHYRRRLLALRIGGNDLLNLLGLRRPSADTVYETPLALTIAQLVTTFRPHGFCLTAPVFEALDRPDVLASEVERDLGYGLFGKTAIHPSQVPVIESRYRVRAEELQAADRILDHGAAPVFRLHGTMCEPATHRAWAELVRERAAIYGVTRAAADEPTILGTVG